MLPGNNSSNCFARDSADALCPPPVSLLKNKTFNAVPPIREDCDDCCSINSCSSSALPGDGGDSLPASSGAVIGDGEVGGDVAAAASATSAVAVSGVFAAIVMVFVESYSSFGWWWEVSQPTETVVGRRRYSRLRTFRSLVTFEGRWCLLLVYSSINDKLYKQRGIQCRVNDTEFLLIGMINSVNSLHLYSSRQ